LARYPDSADKEAPMKNVKMNKVKDKDLIQTIDDFVNLSNAEKVVITKVAADNWTIVATVPK
jgi:hypothetical protein